MKAMNFASMGSVVGFVLATAAAAWGASTTYGVTKLVSDEAGVAGKTDANLVNPWGLAAFAGAPWWVSDNGTGLSTLYDGMGNIQSLVVTIPPAPSGGATTGTPTGIIANSTTDFGGAAFVFDSEDGSVTAWFGAPSAVVEVDNGPGAVYKGLTQGVLNGQNVLYAANFRGGTVDVFDTNFKPVVLAASAFKDSRVPAGWAPFNVQNIAGNIYVSFAKQDSQKHDEVDGAGLGIVDEFDQSGNLLKQFEHGKYLNAPWGFAIAPANFGQFSNDLLVGNFGSGETIAFDPSTGKAVGALTGGSGKPLVVPGLWAIAFGTGGSNGPTNWLYFTAGIQKEAHGLFGYIIAQ